MKKTTLKFLCIFLVLLPSLSHAETAINLEEKKAANPLLLLLGIEALFAVNSWLASQDPQLYGGMAALLFPLAATEGNSSETSQWVTLIAAESLALYNLSLDGDTNSEREIFNNNMVAWHLFVAVVGVTGYFMGDFDPDKNLAFIPTPNGGAKLVFSYRF